MSSRLALLQLLHWQLNSVKAVLWAHWVNPWLARSEASLPANKNTVAPFFRTRWLTVQLNLV